MTQHSEQLIKSSAANTRGDTEGKRARRAYHSFSVSKSFMILFNDHTNCRVTDSNNE